MAQKIYDKEELSFRRIVGFACNQSFVFFLLYMGSNQALHLASLQIERADLLSMLLFMVVGFFVLNRCSPDMRNHLLQRPMLIGYALVMAAASLFPLLGIENVLVGLLAYSLLGFCASLLLTAWGRSFGMLTTKAAIPEVFIGSLAAALLCLVFSLASSPEIMLLMRVFPIASAAWIDSPEPHAPKSSSLFIDDTSQAATLSWKVLVGTLCFGVAAGFMETFGSASNTLAYPGYETAMLLFGAFLIGALSLLLSDGFGKGFALNKSYRLSIFVMMTGILCIPLTSGTSGFSGESVVLAGYLGLEVVLIALFLVIAAITGSDGISAFSRGFMSLFAGEFIGLLCANLLASAFDSSSLRLVNLALAGFLALLSYIFLFTEDDFNSLSKIATDIDSFDEVCLEISSRFGLSKRESETLPFALRGRTSGRIAESLGVSKSTVDTHLRRIYAKTGVHSRQELLDLSDRLRKG